MSRNPSRLTEDIVIVRGNDHISGYFVQIMDKRYARSGKDQQGEGYVLDWDEAFGFTTNYINAQIIDLHDDMKLIELANNIKWPEK